MDSLSNASAKMDEHRLVPGSTLEMKTEETSRENPQIEMDKLSSLVKQHEMSLVSDHDEHSVLSRHSFGHYEDDASIQEGGKYDDLVLSDLIVRLRGDGASQELLASSNADTIATEEDKKEQLTDDMIAKHLKALNSKGKKSVAAFVLEEELSETEEMVITENDNDDMSLVSHDTSYTMDSLDADKSVIETNYDELDEIMRKLGVEIDTEENNESDRQWPSSVGKSNGALDFVDAPQTIASKKIWLANLATELMLEDSSDDASMSTNISEMDHRYQQNRNGLNNHAKLAEMLMAKQTPAPELEVIEIVTEVEPKRQWKAPQTVRKRKTGAAALLAKQAQALSLKQPVVDTTAYEVPSLETGTVETVSVAPKLSNETTSFSATCGPLRKKSIYADKPALPKPKTMAHTLREKALAVNNIRLLPLEKNTSRVSTKAEAGSPDDPVSKNNTQKEPNPLKLPSGDESSKIVESLEQSSRDKGTQPVKNRPSESALILTELVKIATIERSQQPATPDSVKRNEIALPNGLPPYPGYGPRWPWHPDSPRAPKGYRECYMEHMGTYYRQYMTYLKTRAANGGSEETKVEEIMRASLSNQASFKKALRDRKEPTTRRTGKKNKPAIAPDNFASRPGRARMNCAVPVALPRIEEGSSSSGSSDVERNIDEPSETYKKVIQKKTKPDMVTVGNVHKKSKGKVGKIVIKSGKELDKQAKEKKIEERKKQKQRLHSASSEMDSECSSKALPKAPFPEQPVAPTAEQGCACTIM